jgi:glycosyltransferase involved in cell wall biosynthesis
MICVSVKGGFPTIHLAQHLANVGGDFRLITSYPGFYTKGKGISPANTRSVQELFFLEKFLSKVIKRRIDIDWQSNEWFDLRASKLIDPRTRLFTGWSQTSYRSLRAAHALGAKAVVERGSSHIQTQDELLREEHQRFGQPYRGIDSRSIQKELSEYEEADFISVPSSFARQSFIDRGFPEAKLITVPYGVDTSLFVPGTKADQTFRIIQCSSLSLRKGVQYLLQAFSELQLPNSELCLVGGVTPEIEPILKRYRGTNVVMKGTLPLSKLAACYAQGSVFCLPSVEEGMAMVQAQAMACELPLICTTNTGGADIIREGVDGFTVPIRDVEALKEKILKLYEQQDLCRAMGASARQRVVSEFSWTHYAKKTLDTYRQRGLLPAI